MTDLPPLLLARDRIQQGLTSNDLAKSVKAGALVRIRHGVYTDGPAWKDLKPWEQYRLRIQAADETFESPPCLPGTPQPASGAFPPSACTMLSTRSP